MWTRESSERARGKPRTCADLAHNVKVVRRRLAKCRSGCPDSLHRGRSGLAPFLRDVDGTQLVTPVAGPRLQHAVGVRRAAEATVVAAERAEKVAVLDVEIVAQDRAAVAQVGAQVKEVLIRIAAD